MGGRTPNPPTSHQHVTTDAQFRSYCRKLARAKVIAFDTEFVAEHSFRPQLCLIQVAADGDLAVIDPLELSDVRPFWEVLAAEGHDTIVHSGRSEVEFSLASLGRAPANLFDIQLAAGMAGLEYPCGLGTLIAKVTGHQAKKHETRTDWRKRPLSSRQIEYALGDVRYLATIRDTLHARLVERNRLPWLAEDMADWLTEIERALHEERWWRVSGNSNLNGKGLGIVRELWRWRQAEAERRDKPPRTVLRDDMIIELARRQTADVKQVQALRGMEWGKLRRCLTEIVECIERGLATPEHDAPPSPPRETIPQLNMLGQFLSAALASLCQQEELAASLVGTASDVRDLILYRTTNGKNPPPLLARGWRADVVGRLFEDLLDGKVTIRIADPMSPHPLLIERIDGS